MQMEKQLKCKIILMLLAFQIDQIILCLYRY